MQKFANEKFLLVESVIEQIKVDLANGDTTAIEEMLVFLDDERLRAYLPEVEYVEIVKGDGFFCGDN